MSRPTTAALVGRYADRFHAALVDGSHTVTSPLGGWLLLALVAPAAEGETRAALEAALGTDADDALGRASALLGHPHPAVSTAAAVWADPEATTDAFAAWVDGRPPALDAGPIPTQVDADAWAEQRTAGLIDRFPIDLSEAVFVLSNALASRVRWSEPFTVVPADRLGGPWAERVTTVLETGRRDRMGVAATTRAGDVAVHAARSDDGLVVVSVIAAPEVAAVEVLAAAHEVAPLVLLRHSSAAWRSLFDLPLGPGHAWIIREYDAHDPGETELVTGWLPAWRADARHDLLDVDVGFSDAMEAVAPFVKGAASFVGQAVQVACAAFGAEGFEAAAITAMAIVRGMPRPGRTEKVRAAEVRYDRPYAVVALTDVDRSTPGSPGHDWAALPVFAAWIAEPTDA